MINYIIQVVLFQVLFLAVYDFFLSKETFFTKNRWYLLSTPIISFLLPLVKIPTFQKAVSQEYMVYLPEIVLSPEKVIQETAFYQSINYVDIIFGIGVIIFSVLFVYRLITIVHLISSYRVVKKKEYTLVLIPNQKCAFSFFNYIFLGAEIPETQKTQIIAHELVHSKQKHTLDLLLFELLKIVMWYNPMIFIYQKRITLVHEYISDEIATKTATKENYINQMLSNFFQVDNIAFINQFYKHSLIKKRIIMMTKNKSKKMNQLKYLVLIPVLISMLFYTSCSDTTSKEALVSSKAIQTGFRNKDGVLKAQKLQKSTYLDSYIGKEAPIGAKEISLSDLSLEESAEFEQLKEKLEYNMADRYDLKEAFTFRLFKMPNGRNATALILNLEKMKNSNLLDIDEKVETKKTVSFFKIEKKSIFPGCESEDKDCFTEGVQNHFSANFNKDISNNLGLESGKKRIFISFKVATDGTVQDIKVRAPHPEIEQEVVRVISSLPKMEPGENKGKKVAVSFNIPFVLLIE